MAPLPPSQPCVFFSSDAPAASSSSSSSSTSSDASSSSTSDRLHSTDIAFKPNASGWGGTRTYSSNFKNIFGQKKKDMSGSGAAVGGERKAGVATDSEISAFFLNNKAKDIIVVDARNPDFEVEKGDAKYGADSGHKAIAGLVEGARPRALNLPYNRESKSLPLEPLEALLKAEKKGKDAPIITHCGGGGRGQKAKEFLEQQGFSNVINGGGPKETGHWIKFGAL